MRGSASQTGAAAVGCTETAVFELKRVLGMKADATLTVRDTFEALVQRESAVAPQIPGHVDDS